MFGIKREMFDSDGDHMIGYLTAFGEYGVRSEAYEYDSYEDAEEECENERGYYRQEFPDDQNDFWVVDFDLE